ncbi:ImmA/IrrE family metallo-endopeptidase [Thermodesulfovibrio sp. TK110]
MYNTHHQIFTTKYEDVRLFARQILKKNNITEPPVDILKIARFYNAEVIPIYAEQDFCGCVLPIKKKIKNKPAYLILVNIAGQTDGRKIFTIAHEIAHIALGHDKYATYATNLSYKAKNRMEKLCDIFASEILMPKHFVIKYFYKHKKTENIVETLSEIFCVSKEAIQIRLKELELK